MIRRKLLKLFFLLQVESSVKVNIQLRRPSDNITSEPLPFEFLPVDSGRLFWSKKLKGNYGVFSNILAANTALMTMSVQAKHGQVVKTHVANNERKDVVEVEPVSAEVKPMETDNSDDYAQIQKPDSDDVMIIGEKHPLQTVQVTDVGPAIDVGSVYSEVNGNAFMTDDDLSQGETCKSVNELLSQVDDFTCIYSENQSVFERTLPRTQEQDIYIDKNKNVLENTSVPCPGFETEMQIETKDRHTPVGLIDDTYESQTYSSFQLAMKNPILIDIHFEDTCLDSSPPRIVESVKREVPPADSKLPPLPPKRQRKLKPDDYGTVPPLPPRSPQLMPRSTEISQSQSVPKIEPPPQQQPSLQPQPAPPPVPQPQQQQSQSISAQPSLVNVSQPSPEKATTTKTPSPTKSSKPNIFQKLFSRKSSKNLKNEKRTISEPCINADIIAPPSSPPASMQTNEPYDLTEAEHYALYTDMAPQATVSECDDFSLCYSPVGEGFVERQQPVEAGGDSGRKQ